MISHEQTRELINEINELIEHAENGTLDYSPLEHARKVVFNAEIEKDKLPTEDEVKADIKEIAHYFGGWEELQKIVQQMKDNADEEAGERAMNEPEAWEGGFADNH